MRNLERRTIERIRECANEREVMAVWRKYIEEAEEKIAVPHTRRKEDKVGLVVKVAREVARRVSTPEERIRLSEVPKEIAQKHGIEVGVMILPPYEDRFRGFREWMEKDNRRFGRHIHRICAVIVELAGERIDDRFTAHDLYRRVPEVSFVVDPLLDQLEKMGFLEFGCFAFVKFGEKEERKVMRLKREWESEQEMAIEVMKGLEKNGQIPYEMIHIGNRNDYIEWQR